MSGAAVRCRYSECMTVMKSDLPVVKVADGSNAERRLGQQLASPADPSAQAAHPVCNPARVSGTSAPARASVLVAGGVLRVGALVWARQAGCHKYFGLIITVLII